MKTLTRKQLKEYVPYCDTHLRRLEASGDFPKRIKIGRNRVVWLKDDVLNWLKTRVDESQLDVQMCVANIMLEKSSVTQKIKEAWLRR